jgi:Tfp pilus assembly protein PilN
LVLKSVKQTGTKLVIVGSTNSQSKVSVFMRNLETSQHLKNATLIEIQSSGSGDNDFTINVDFVRTDDTPSKV